MEVNRILSRSLLAAAIFGIAGMSQAEEQSITTDTAVQNANVTVESAEIPAAAPEEATMKYAYASMAPGFLVPADANSPTINFDVNGYINAGGMFNTHGANYNMMSANSDNQFGLDGAYIAVEKKAKNGCGQFDWGFGADSMFGRDARFMHGYAGLDDDLVTGHTYSNYNYNPMVKGGLTDEERANYGFAVPQLYGEFAINNMTFKAGHFYSLLGYESVRADQRFFYSLGRSFEVTPHTHSGALATFKGMKNMEWTVGWVMGENNTFERDYKESLITGAVKLSNGDLASLKYAFLAGDGAMGKRGGDLFRNDVVLSGKLSSRLETAFIFNYGSFDGEDANAKAPVTSTVTDIMRYCHTDNMKYQTWGGYCFYTLNPKWKIGTRIEWQRATTDLKETMASMELFETGIGANWMPLGSDIFVVRPEIRYDRAFSLDKYEGIYGNELSKKDQVGLGIDMVCKF